MMNETEFRSAIAAEAMTWKDTPYHPNGALKGVGVNCAQFLFMVAKNAGVIPADAPLPRWYTPQLATNSKEERLVAYVTAYGATEISEADVKPGDIVLYKTGQAHGHAAIVLDYPRIIHVLPIHGCQMGSADEGKLGALNRRYFTLWKGSN
jgi:cell wall-associated NlpC family hydrolase